MTSRNKFTVALRRLLAAAVVLAGLALAYHLFLVSVVAGIQRSACGKFARHYRTGSGRNLDELLDICVSQPTSVTYWLWFLAAGFIAGSAVIAFRLWRRDATTSSEPENS